MDNAFAGRAIASTPLQFGAAERKLAYDNLNCATDRDVDFVMLGCPHNSIDQVALIALLLEGRSMSANTQLWVHTPRALREVAERNGYVKMITRCRRRGDERHLPRDLTLCAEGHQSHRADSGEAGALSAGDPRPPGAGSARVKGMRRCGADRPMERRRCNETAS